MKRLWPLVPAVLLLAVWQLASSLGWFPVGTVPSPLAVARGFGDEIASGNLGRGIVASLYRVSFGFVGAVLLAVPLGLWVGRKRWARAALLPWVNFFRSMSPIAWIPFAIVWFGIGDPPAIFIIAMATFFQMMLATMAATLQVPSVYYRVSTELGWSSQKVLFAVTLPAIMPQLLVSLRLAIGVAWMVVVAAEMIGVRGGLGYLILDARNGLRMDLVVVGMITIGVVGIALDWLFARMGQAPSAAWGFHDNGK